MDRVWLKLIGVMIFAGIVKYAVVLPLFWVAVDLAALAVCYLLLRSVPYINLRVSMLYLGCFTAISILVDLSVIGSLTGSVLSLLIIGWLLWRNQPPRIKKTQLRHRWHK
ncbi:MAG: hypothetical protein E6X17_15560 [Sporomusaceae bacterium]|nr:hypothetical protein [Sporomusaceae bacterium]